MRSKHTASAGRHTSIFPSGSIVLTLLKCLEITWDNLDLECKGMGFRRQIAPESSAMPLWLKVTTPLISIPSRKCSSLISLLGSAKITSCQFPLCFLYHKQSIGLTGNFRIWNRFSQNGNFQGGLSTRCPLEHSQVKTVDLLKSHFGNGLRESFTLLPGCLIEDCSSFSEWISCYRITKYGLSSAEIPCRAAGLWR